jgi:diacylglycerol kinase (ATP)
MKTSPIEMLYTRPVRIATKSSQKGSIRPDIALIVNPSSGSGTTGKVWDSFYPKIKTVLGRNPKVAFTKGAGDGTVLARDFLRKGFMKIVALGGDGTFNEVANGFFEDPVGIRRGTDEKKSTFPSPPKLKPINPEAAMTLVPCGTRNVLAKSLALPPDGIECLRALSLGNTRSLDVITVTATNRVDRSTAATRVLLNAAELGLGAEVIDRSKKVRKAVNNRLASTIAGVISTVPAYQSNECQVLLENGPKQFTTNMTMTIVANGSYIGGGLKVAPKADMSDGLLDLVILKDSGSLKILNGLVSMKEGDYRREKNIIYRQVKRMSLKSEERDVTVSIDGEPIGTLPATFEVMHKALKITM